MRKEGEEVKSPDAVEVPRARSKNVTVFSLALTRSIDFLALFHSYKLSCISFNKPVLRVRVGKQPPASILEAALV